jgi:aspartate aminotransferase-like enzyme
MNAKREKTEKLNMTPGPTRVACEVLEALSTGCSNPDLDPQFLLDYESLTGRLGKFLNTKSDVLVLGGEGILGLEAACSSLIEPGDRVLCVSNGPFGRGFASFVSMYGGIPVLLESDFQEPVSAKSVEDYLKDDSDFKALTIIHCETPTGVLNPIEDICPVAKKYGILTIVDAVSSIGAHDILTDEWQIDILLGASQKCFSAPSGLTFLTVSDSCWKVMAKRKEPVRSYYSNLKLWENWKSEAWFPYTMPWHLINAFAVALERVFDEDDVFGRHRDIALATRTALTKGGLKLYSESGFSNSVTAFLLPEEIQSSDFLNFLSGRYNLLLGGSIGLPSDYQVVRVGHMGENCQAEFVKESLETIEKALKEVGIVLQCSLKEAFEESIG